MWDLRAGAGMVSAGLDASKYPNLAAEEAFDHEQHVRQAMETGLTRSQAERHASQEQHER